MNKQKYIDMLEDYINCDLSKKILENEDFNKNISGDIPFDLSFKIMEYEEKIVDIIIQNFKRNQQDYDNSML